MKQTTAAAALLALATMGAAAAFPGTALAATTRTSPATATRISTTATRTSVARAAAPDHIRYASVRSCPTKDGQSTTCGPWRLVTHHGMVIPLKDAQVESLTWKGKPGGIPAPITVSDDGATIAYFHRKDGRLAVRDLSGKVLLLPKTALPARTDQFAVNLMLSHDGRRLAVVFTGEKPSRTRLFDTATGTMLATVPAENELIGFSADGDEVLTKNYAESGVLELRVYDDGGDRRLTRVPPQIVANNGKTALDAGGERIAVVIEGLKPKLVIYDAHTDQVLAKHPIKIAAGQSVHAVSWTGDTQVTVHLTRYTSAGTKMKIVQYDTTNGHSGVRDSYTILADSYTFAACGG